VSDPLAAGGIASSAAGLWPRFTVEGVPGGLPRPGEPLAILAEVRVTESFLAERCPAVFLPIRATLSVRVTDYDGKEIAARSVEGTFPGVARLDFGRAPGPGYYSLRSELRSPDGRLVRRFHPGGFSVVLGNAAQRERLARKKTWCSWYYAFSDWDSFAPWLERMGIFKNVGSTPGAPAWAEAKWKDASSRGIVLFADFAGDSHWLNNSESDARALVEMAARYTRHFKSVNEIDGRQGPEWLAARAPAKWVERAKWQHEAVHAARADALYVGGSLYCSGVDRPRGPGDPSPREWFRRCLELGLDRYVDAWDVHVYPHNPPRLEASSASDGSLEADRGVLDVYAELGRRNEKPFFLGETSALVWHGFAGLRWQADTIAKMIAWANSRADWLGIAFCAPHHDRRITAEEYAMAHDPGEAAMYTASALVDGRPYRRIASDDPELQAAWFGDTLMVWRSDERTTGWSARLDGAGPWLLVDVVGRARPLEVEHDLARFRIGQSPVYVLAQTEYQRLTRGE